VIINQFSLRVYNLSTERNRTAAAGVSLARHAFRPLPLANNTSEAKKNTYIRLYFEFNFHIDSKTYIGICVFNWMGTAHRNHELYQRGAVF
jgi:hypothetical protein